MINSFLKWWLLVILIVIITSFSAYFNFFQFLIEKDLTNLGIFTLFVFTLSTISIGYKIFNGKNDYDIEWFFSDAVISIGMVGTVIGFIYMLFSVFSDLSLDDPDKMLVVLSEMANGMSTALLTTLIGLISSLFLKFQLVIATKRNHV